MLSNYLLLLVAVVASVCDDLSLSQLEIITKATRKQNKPVSLVATTLLVTGSFLVTTLLVNHAQPLLADQPRSSFHIAYDTGHEWIALYRPR
jgi:hypothetical protein